MEGQWAMTSNLRKGYRLMVDTSEINGMADGVVRRSIVSVNGEGIPSIKMKGRQIQIPLGCIRRVITRGKCIETPFGLDYFRLNTAKI